MTVLHNLDHQAKQFFAALEYGIRMTVAVLFEEEAKPALKAQQTFETTE